MKNKIIHIIYAEKFTLPFIEFIHENFDKNQHKFIIIGENHSFTIQNGFNIINIQKLNVNRFLNLFLRYKLLNTELMNADRIIIHGLWSQFFNRYLFLNPSLLKKTFWIIWGGDLYSYRNDNGRIQEFFRKFVIKNLYGIIAYNKEEYNLAVDWYQTKAKFYASFFYPSNLYEEIDIEESSHDSYNIQIGNSADPSNNHIEVLNMLEKFKNQKIKIYVPLSYGNMEYASRIMKTGKKLFGDKFIPLTDYMPFDDYITLLGKIDIAIFNHNRQQAMGNITTLLGLGKKVYMQTEVTSYIYLKSIDIEVYDINNFELKKLNENTKIKNKNNVKNYFSINNLISQWKEILLDTK